MAGCRRRPTTHGTPYRRALVYGYYMWAITWRTDRTITEIYIDRMGAAVQEHESFERLGL